jgi:primosomal protein N' (replication factor Y) (superfamily II helicase)
VGNASAPDRYQPGYLAVMDETPARRRFVEVALPLPLFRTFTYELTHEPANPLVPGSRVIVPLRAKKAVGICLGVSDDAGDVKRPKAILEVPDSYAALSESMLALCRWIADYYVVPIGLTLRSALPGVMTEAHAPQPQQKMRRIATITSELPSLMQRDEMFSRSRRQRELFELLESMGGRAPADHLITQLGCSTGVLKSLVARGLISITSDVVERDPFAARPLAAAHNPQPSDAQRAAIDAMIGASPGEVFLLHGITGSGKTLVYIELLRRVLAQPGRTAIVLVPEIALTPQTVDRFRAVFGDQVAVLHSALSDGERYDAWLALSRGERRIAVGARSAIFAPLANVGAIILDEEHESSYKQGESPRYHAREVAVVRARHEGAVVVLGSATPSLESWVNAASGKYRLLSLPDRVGGGRLPHVEVVDLRRGQGIGADVEQRPAAKRSTGSPAFRSVITEPLEEAIAARLERREQSILLLNRRGYASFIQCRDCGDVTVCPYCSITLTYHRYPEGLVCHYCGHREAVSAACQRCSGVTLRQLGVGTQQVERLLAERYGSAVIARMDVDTTGAKWAHAEILDRVASGSVDILLGTQMIAKGLDFPNVTLVGVIDADVGINLPDFRASERCFQLLSQVAGRAGRGPKGGEVLIQTRAPGHHAVRCALTHDYHGFVREELPGREHPAYPPFLRLARAVFSGTREDAVAELAADASDWLRRLTEGRPELAVTLVGPSPCPVERIKGRWRWHVLLKAENPASLGRVGRYFMERYEVPNRAGLRMTFDRDPVALL